MAVKGLVAVLDVGKTTAKVIVADAGSGAVRWSVTRPTPTGATLYRQIEVRTIGDFLVEALASAPDRAKITTIVPVAHGACVALLNGDELALPVMDYEEPATEEIAADYATERDSFSETLSPALPFGLNLGRQLAFLEARFPDAFHRADRILPYAQYWSWRMSGVAATEVTSLGAHTDLWRPLARRWSRLAERRGWAGKFPDFRPASDVLGPIRPEIARATGLPMDAQVLCGIHDSNASFLRWLAGRAPDTAFAVVSSGTWTIVMANGAPLDRLDERRDMLANVNVHGAPVPTARFMGGREYGLIVGAAAAATPGLGDLDQVLAEEAMALPSFSPTGGPFQGRTGRLVGAERLSPGALAALATLYLALVTDRMLDLLGASGEIIIEGPLATSPLFGPLLSGLRPATPVLRSSDRSGTLGGALVLAGRTDTSTPLEACIAFEDARLPAYRRKWAEEVSS
jgi:L-fuculokinase